MARVKRKVERPPDIEPPHEQGPASFPELVESLYRLLYGQKLESRRLGSEISLLETRYGKIVYSELIYLLSHLRFDPDEAVEHWRRIIAHRDSMRKRLGTSVDIRVALVSYFVEVNRKLENPKIIELKVFEQTQASAYKDELTGLCNFRFFREYLTREIQRGERYSPPLSLVMIDIDNFKAYNDRNGHEAGNQVLAKIAQLLSDALRTVDVPARYGGEEFALILPSTAKTGALLVAERARLAIERHPFPNEEGQPSGRLTVSMGVATFPADAREASELVRRADRALYVAKSRGKNQVHLYANNRRSYRRVNATLDGKFCTLATDLHPLTTLNVSEGGLLFIAEQNLPVGSLIDVKLSLPGSDHPIQTTGRVVRVKEKSPGEFEAAIRVIDTGTADQLRLARFIQEAADSADEDEEVPRNGDR